MSLQRPKSTIFSEEHCKNISEGKKNNGFKHSEESKRLMSIRIKEGWKRRNAEKAAMRLKNQQNISK